MSDDETSGTTGGTETHTHTGTTGNNSVTTDVDDNGVSVAADPHTHDFTTDSSSNLPPYYELVYFIKVK